MTSFDAAGVKPGMAEYPQCFVENRIDLSVLPDVTDQDLGKLGPLLGDRRKMLRAAGDLGSVSVAPAAPSMPVASEPTWRDSAERRRETVANEGGAYLRGSAREERLASTPYLRNSRGVRRDLLGLATPVPPRAPARPCRPSISARTALDRPGSRRPGVHAARGRRRRGQSAARAAAHNWWCSHVRDRTGAGATG
jgi:hypothetical protein